jgi:hypothetical protein
LPAAPRTLSTGPVSRRSSQMVSISGADVHRLALRAGAGGAEEIERAAHHGLHLVQVAQHPGADLAVGQHLGAQPQARDRLSSGRARSR